MRKLLINIQPTLFNYSGYILDNENIAAELTTIPFDRIDMINFAKSRAIDAIVLKGPINYIQGIQSQLQEKTDIPIELYEVHK